MRRVALILAAVIPLTLSGCGDSTGPGGAVVGTYTLRTLNGDPVPAVDEFGNEVTAGSVRLNANGTFSTSHTYRISSSNEITLVSNGTYTRSGNDLTLLFEDPETGEMLSVDAVWDGDRLTVDDGFDVWVYER